MSNSPYTDWFNRRVGQWTSQRRYLYIGAKTTVKQVDTAFEVAAKGDSYVISWDSGEDGEGEMAVTPVGNELFRDSGYFSDEPTTSVLQYVDDDTIVMTTRYGGGEYREEIRLLYNDTVALRQTVGRRGDKIVLVGQYFERKV